MFQPIPNSFDELKNFLCSSQKLKFCLKLYYCLNFVDKHNETRDLIGVEWDKDGTSFFCNSFILGNFLDLKQNSINTNLRAHGFQVENLTNSEMEKYGKKQWKKRRSNVTNFNKFTTPQEANDIPMLQGNSDQNSNLTQRVVVDIDKDNVPPNVEAITEFVSPFQTRTVYVEKSPSNTILSEFVKLWPKETQQLITGPTAAAQQASIVDKLISLPLPQDEQNKLLQKATRLWISVIGNKPAWGMLEAVNKLIVPKNITQDLAYQMRINFISLVDQDVANSQVEELHPSKMVLRFDQFFSFFVRYGSPLEPHNLLEEVSYSLLSQDPQSGKIKEYTYEDPPEFVPGFLPNLNKKLLINELNEQNLTLHHPWGIIHSKQPNRFVLYACIQKNGVNKIVKLYITFNAATEDETARFSIPFGENYVKTVGTYNELINALALKKENAISHNYYPSKIDEIKNLSDFIERDTQQQDLHFSGLSSQIDSQSSRFGDYLDMTGSSQFRLSQTLPYEDGFDLSFNEFLASQRD